METKLPAKLYHGDCLELAEALQGRPLLERPNLIYLEPPANNDKKFYATLSKAKVIAYSDIFRWDSEAKKAVKRISKLDNPLIFEALKTFKEILGEGSTLAYLVYMTERLYALYGALRDDGSMYLHSDSRYAAYFRFILDAIFGSMNFRADIIWAYRTGGASPKKNFAKKHDNILYYTKSDKHTFNTVKERSYVTGRMAHTKKGTKRADKDGVYEVVRFSETDIKLYKDKDNRYYTMVGARSVWQIDALGKNAKERTGYPNQKPNALLERIIRASSNVGDLVLDPFSGSGTTADVAYDLERGYIAVDNEVLGLEMTRERHLKKHNEDVKIIKLKGGKDGD